MSVVVYEAMNITTKRHPLRGVWEGHAFRITAKSDLCSQTGILGISSLRLLGPNADKPLVNLECGNMAAPMEQKMFHEGISGQVLNDFVMDHLRNGG